MPGKTRRAQERVQIQFRLGEALVSKIDAAAEAETDEDGNPAPQTRNDWLVDACVKKLKGEGRAGVFVASEVTARRVPILFRVDPRIKKAIDKDWKGKKISSRTMWIVEAILARLTGYEWEENE
jgi:hypothetical protein